MSEICGICRDGKPDFITRCSHHFHHKCFLLWHTTKNTCPYCRIRLTNSKKIENAIRNYQGDLRSFNKLTQTDLLELLKNPPAHPYELKFELIIDSLLKFGSINLNEPLEKKSETLISKACAEGSISKVLYLITKCGVDINLSDPFSNNYTVSIAIEKGNLELFNLLVEHGANLKVHSKLNKSPMEIACEYARPAFVERLLELADWDMHSLDRQKYYPLHNVARKYWHKNQGTEADRISITKMLLAKGANINATDGSGITPINHAVSAGYADLVEFFLQRGANVSQNINGNWTLLKSASMGGHLEIVKKLIEYGADVKLRDKDKFNALHHACKRGSLEIAKILIEKGCDVNSKGKDHLTPLHLAAEAGKRDLVKYLLEKGVKIDAQIKYESVTPLLMALENKKYEVATLLIESGADINLGNSMKEYPLHVAIENSLDSVAFLLLDKGCRIDSVNMYVETALKYLCKRTKSRPDYRLGLRLLEMGANPNNTFEDYSPSPLLSLCYTNSSMKLVTALIKHGADIRARDADGKSVLHRAVYAGNLKLVKKLIEIGADVNATDSNGRYPIHYILIGIRDKLIFPQKTEYRKFYKIIKALVSAGADINAQTKSGVTAFHYFRYNSELKVLKRFVKYGANIFKCDLNGRDLESRAKVRNLKKVIEWIKTLKTNQ